MVGLDDLHRVLRDRIDLKVSSLRQPLPRQRRRQLRRPRSLDRERRLQHGRLSQPNQRRLGTLRRVRGVFGDLRRPGDAGADAGVQRSGAAARR